MLGELRSIVVSKLSLKTQSSRSRLSKRDWVKTGLVDTWRHFTAHPSAVNLNSTLVSKACWWKKGNNCGFSSIVGIKTEFCLCRVWKQLDKSLHSSGESKTNLFLKVLLYKEYIPASQPPKINTFVNVKLSSKDKCYSFPDKWKH